MIYYYAILLYCIIFTIIYLMLKLFTLFHKNTQNIKKYNFLFMLHDIQKVSQELKIRG